MEENFFNATVSILQDIEQTQMEIITHAARVIAKAIEDGGVLHAFGSGHSHMMVEELFYRAGGLVPVNPIFDSNLMLHKGALRSSLFERQQGYAELILTGIDLRPGEPMIIISHSGINTLPVEMAALAKSKELFVIAITSPRVSSQLDPRAESGKRLMDIADIVVDNCIKDSELAIQYDTDGHRVGAYSTIANSFVIQKLVIEVTKQFVEGSKKPPIFQSANLPGGDEWNRDLIKKYKSRINLL